MWIFNAHNFAWYWTNLKSKSNQQALGQSKIKNTYFGVNVFELVTELS